MELATLFIYSKHEEEVMEQYGKPEYSIDSTSAILKSVFSRVKDFSETGKDGKEIHVSGFVIVFEDVYHVGLLNGSLCAVPHHHTYRYSLKRPKTSCFSRVGLKRGCQFGNIDDKRSMFSTDHPNNVNYLWEVMRQIEEF